MSVMNRNTMAELTRTVMSLFLILMLQFKAATGQDHLVFTVKDGHDVTLPCGNVTSYQKKCDGTTWLLSSLTNPAAVALLEHGQIKTESESDRLSVTEKCSLLIKKVTEEDVGLYTCRQFDKSGRQQGSDSLVELSVVTMNEDGNTEMPRLRCSVLTDGPCKHTVDWLYEGHEDDVEKSLQACSASVTFTTFHPDAKTFFKLLMCTVTHISSNEVQQFALSEEPSVISGLWCVYVVVAVVSATLLVGVSVLIRLKKIKGKKRQIDGNVGPSRNPAEPHWAPETDEDTTEDGVSYVAISFTRTTSRKVQPKSDDDERDAVTYSTVKAPCSSASDPSSLYAAID